MKLGNFIRRRVRDPTDADDILQDVFQEFIEACRLPAPIKLQHFDVIGDVMIGTALLALALLWALQRGMASMPLAK